MTYHGVSISREGRNDGAGGSGLGSVSMVPHLLALYTHRKLWNRKLQDPNSR